MRTNLKRSHVICLLPERERFGKATQQLIVDTEVFCRELGFSTKIIRSLISFISNLVFSRYKLYIVLYPGTYSPIVKSFKEFIIKVLISLGLYFLRLLGRKIILYVYDLPIEQNIFVWGKVPKERFSRIIEMMFLKNASVILVFNILSSRWLTTRYNLDMNRFEYFELLDYGSNIQTLGKKKDRYLDKIVIIFSGAFDNPKLREKIELFLQNCSETMNIIFLLIGKNSHLIKLTRSNVKKLNEVDQKSLPIIYNRSNFGLVLKASPYYEFGSTSKFSSYIHSGLPVLVPQDYWYLSTIVKKYSVGIIFKDCQDLMNKLSRLSSLDYYLLVENARSLGYKIQKGYFFKKAILKAFKKVRN